MGLLFDVVWPGQNANWRFGAFAKPNINQDLELTLLEPEWESLKTFLLSKINEESFTKVNWKGFEERAKDLVGTGQGPIELNFRVPFTLRFNGHTLVWIEYKNDKFMMQDWERENLPDWKRRLKKKFPDTFIDQ